jgi:hypothetical protein
MSNNSRDENDRDPILDISPEELESLMEDLGDLPIAGPPDAHAEALAQRCSFLSGEIANILELVEKGVRSEDDAAGDLEKHMKELSSTIGQLEAWRVENQAQN